MAAPRAAGLHYTVRRNIFMRSCFRLACGLTLTAALHAAGGAGEPAPRPGGVTSAIRVDRRTGKLVRQVVPPPDSQAGEARAALAKSFEHTVNRIAAESSLPPELVHSVIQVESNYNPYAVSPKGALGMMQLIPATAKRFGVKDAFDPEENIRGGSRYLRYLLDLYGGDSTRALAAYNAGEGAVARYGNVPPYPETQVYVQEVNRRVEASKAAAPAQPPAVVKAPEPEQTGPRHIRGIVGVDGSVRYVTQ
jgi:soluble lytic murein transglycosylase-like protein